MPAGREPRPAGISAQVEGGRGPPLFPHKGPQDPQCAAGMLPLRWARISPGLHSHPSPDPAGLETADLTGPAFPGPSTLPHCAPLRRHHP